MIPHLTELLLAVSSVLLVPVILLLLTLLAAVIVLAGGLCAEALSRWRGRRPFLRFLREVREGGRSVTSFAEIPAPFGLPQIAKVELQRSRDHDKTLDDLQLYSERLLGRLMLGVRLGPVLGLAGTLIPLGPALVALSSGDIVALSSRLVVAFSTTIVGLIVGGACFAMHSVRRHWYMQDLNDIEYLARKLETP